MAAVVALLTIAVPARAQDTTVPASGDVRLTPDWDVGAYQPYDADIAFTLDRPLQPGDGRLALFVGRADLSALVSVLGQRVRLPLRGERIPAGDLQVEAWRIGQDGEWHALGTFALRRLTPLGFEEASARPRLDVQSDGQVDAEAPGSDRGTSFHDLTLNGGVDGLLKRGGWDIGWQGLVTGASHRPARLRAAQLGSSAPAVDLASYGVRVARGPFALSAGHVTIGTHRLLTSQHRSRGVAADLALGRRVTIGLGTAAATEIVGWSDPLGITRPSHRIVSGTIGVELAPAHPGLLRVELSAMNGSRQPAPAFTQQAVTDRETSRGFGAQIVVADPTQRVRLAAGWARSRFGNPVDPALTGDSVVVAVREETRAARFGELTVEALRGAHLGPVPASLAIVVRHERTDPLYRSIAAFVQSDREQNTLEATGAMGPVQWQAAAGRGRDNLADVPSLLVTRTGSRSLAASLPVAALAAAEPDDWWWPTLSVAWQGMHQRGDSLPAQGGFRDESQRPDQYAGTLSANAGWQHAAWSIAYRYNRSVIDNRQFQRERADFISDGHGASLSLAASARLTVALDVAHERQRSVETDATATSRRVGGQAEWRPFGQTAFVGAASLVGTRDDGATQRGRNVETRLEMSQGFNLWVRSAEESQARAFVRWARTGVGLRLAGVPQPSFTQWTLNAGLSLRVF